MSVSERKHNKLQSTVHMKPTMVVATLCDENDSVAPPSVVWEYTALALPAPVEARLTLSQVKHWTRLRMEPSKMSEITLRK